MKKPRFSMPLTIGIVSLVVVTNVMGYFCTWTYSGNDMSNGQRIGYWMNEARFTEATTISNMGEKVCQENVPSNAVSLNHYVSWDQHGWTLTCRRPDNSTISFNGNDNVASLKHTIGYMMNEGRFKETITIPNAGDAVCKNLTPSSPSAATFDSWNQGAWELKCMYETPTLPSLCADG